MASQTRLLKGSRVGSEYVVHKLLGLGGYATVYILKNDLDNSFAAYKVDSQEEIEKEGKHLAKLNGLPYFPTFFGIEQCGRSIGIVMSEEGMNIWRYACGGPDKILGKHNILVFLYHAVKAMAALHSMQLVHRDIKSDNFVLGVTARKAPVVLIDLCYAQKFDGVNRVFTKPHPSFLEVDQAAPQILRGGTFSESCDFFLLAFTTMDLIGHRFENHSTNNQKRAAIQDERFEKLPELLASQEFLRPILKKIYTVGLPDEFPVDCEAILAEIRKVKGFNPNSDFTPNPFE